jgi:hypothetical protein
MSVGDYYQSESFILNNLLRENIAKDLVVKNLDFFNWQGIFVRTTILYGFKIVRKDLSKTKDSMGVQRLMKGLTTSIFSKLHSFNVEDSNKLDQFLAMLEMAVHDNP